MDADGRLRVLDLFSGVGGFSLGLERAGMTTVGFCEIDPFCRAVLKKHWPEVPCHDDITTLLEPREENMAGKLRKLTQEQAAEAVQMYERGMSLAPIAEFFGVSRQSMHDLLKRRTTMRPQTRCGPDNHFYRGGPKAEDRVHNLLEEAVERGIVVPQPCENCGANGTFEDGRREVQAHHDDYNKPLDVRWLCQKCHHEWHKHNTPIARKEDQFTEAADVVVGGFP